ncbi:membrane-spanning 4-domains subfamily A member 4A-like [Corythoichthys intestinalis]|uniref:membrane-spanning 4-domains subfamily A member 4A-like n=1 Tax=Corythoichthys intestinalis TaxID=161448 RepID=UPI0025A56C18|nr:membrane-spanning 4-domains subfamily A member 4A-like [Corythoichthys intestinalis]
MEDQDVATPNPLVTVTFQRDAKRKQKYLEAEPKALGITQIVLSVHQISCVSAFPASHRDHYLAIPFIVASILVLIAGSVSVAAKNLHLPTLRGSLGMQVVSCVASFFNVIWLLIDIESNYTGCWRFSDDYNTTNAQLCQSIKRTKHHIFAQNMLVQVALLAISVTLSAYACKVANCCGPAPKMPVIMLQTPDPSHEQAEG